MPPLCLPSHQDLPGPQIFTVLCKVILQSCFLQGGGEGGDDLKHFLVSFPFLQQMVSRLYLAGCEQKVLVKQLRQRQSTYGKKKPGALCRRGKAWKNRSENLHSRLLKLRVLAKTMDACAQKERTWATTSSWGGKGGFVEHYLVQGDKRRPALWRGGQSWHAWSPDALAGNDDSFQWDGLGLK